MSPEFTIGEDRYRVVPMDPMTQLFVLKRLMRFVPALTASDDVLSRIRAREAVQPEDVLGTVTALAPLLADTPDADFNFVLDNCLNITRQIVDGQGFAVRNPQNGSISNQVNAAVVRKLTIVANVLRIVLAPMIAEIAPTIGGMGEDVEAAA